MNKKELKIVIKEQNMKLKAIKIFVNLAIENDGIFISTRKEIDSFIKNQKEINQIILQLAKKDKIKLIEKFDKINNKWEFLKLQNDSKGESR